MPISNSKVKQLVEDYHKISLLNKTKAVLDWDMNVNLPSKGSEGRAKQVALLTEFITNQWLDPQFKSNLEEASLLSNLNPEEKAVIRNLNYQGKYYYRVPKEVIVEFSRTTSEAFMIWQKAKKDNRFKDFAPVLKKIIKLNQIIADHLGYINNPYDALLDLYEPGLTAEVCQKIFKKLQSELKVILKSIQSSKGYRSESELVGGEVFYPSESQKKLAEFILKKMGYDLEAGRVDVSTHPFETVLDRFDIRITTWYHENDFRDSFTAAMHEAGHALYEQGINVDYSDTPLSGGVSYAIHESQSRFWENVVGRSEEFIEFMAPVFQAFYSAQLGHIGSDTLMKLFNQVKPSLIRVEADEVTYNSHIILRFELENSLINGKIEVGDLPEVWKAKMKQHLGISPKTDREGVLQDVHWSLGYMGYFPTYALGNLYGAQFASKMKKELNMRRSLYHTDIKELLRKGELGTLLSWLRENIHQYGSLYWPEELLKKVTGKELDPTYFTDYLKEKYSKIYGVKF